MSSKKAEDLFIRNGDYHAPALRGAFEQWVNRDWSIVDGFDATIKVQQGRDKDKMAYMDFEAWLNRKVDDDWFKDVKEEYGTDRPWAIFLDYWVNNDEFRREVMEHVEVVDLAGNPGTNNSSSRGSGGGSGGEDSAEKDQASFGKSQFPELHDLGVVDDEGKMHRSKLRGLVAAFTKDIDVIKGETDNFEVKWAQHAFLYWGADKWGEEWHKIVAKYAGTDYIYDAVSFMYSGRDVVAETMEGKYEGGCKLEVGNPDTDDLSKAFLDSEEPGWDDDGEQDNEARHKDKWDRFEEQSEEIEHDTGGEEEKDTEDEEADKWERFKEEAGVRDVDEAEYESENGANGDTADSPDADDLDRGDDNNPGTLGEWAEKEGKADPDEFKNNGSRKERASKDKKDTTNGKSKVTERVTGDLEPEVQCEDWGRPYPIKWPDVQRIEELERNNIYEGNTFEWALKLPENSVDTIVTSPPYYNLRDYDIEDAVPISGDWTCEHHWEDEFCTECGAFLGQLGAEPDPATFVEHIVDLMDRYKTVLKPTGSLWLNIGDTYAGENFDGRVKAGEKSRMMIPERVYRRMVQTGWRLRDYVIWAKKVWMPDDDLRGNGKPFASGSRLADQWEPMVRFTPHKDSYNDVNSNRLLPPSFDGDMGTKGSDGKFRKGEDTQRGRTYNAMGTNPSDVWLINSDGYQGDHRAVFPEELPKRCIRLTTPDRVCEICGVPFEKEVHVEDEDTVSPGGDYATYERRCRHDGEHKPGIAFDPFLGSGTTGLAAANAGFDWAGTELSEKYAKLARERIPTGRQVGIDQWSNR